MIDEVREAKELFDKLNDTLTASWDTMYGYAKPYYEQNGDLKMSHQYKAPNGYCLGAWVNKPKKKFREGKLEEPYISLLNELEITWDKSSKAYFWDEMLPRGDNKETWSKRIPRKTKSRSISYRY